MRQWLFLLFLIIAIPLWASTPLYESLKTDKQQVFESRSDSLDTNATQFDQELYTYWMQSLLKQQFHSFNPRLNKDYIVTDINVNEHMSADARALTEDTLYTQVALITAVGVLVVLPQSISKWDLEELGKKSLDERWKEHVTTKPVWDKDDWPINYIGHPVFGAVYYAMARNDGMDIFESALFSTVMSTFFWEYGYEAFAEIPSVQDLIFTPLLGSFLGEGMHILELKLDANHGIIWGSKGLGSFSYFWLDPMGNIAGGLSDFLDVSVTMEFANFQRYQDQSQFRYSNDQAYPERFQDRDYGFMLTFY